jgi:hypothetical protein
MFERPITTAWSPLRLGTARFARIAEPVGVQGTSVRSPIHVLVGIDGVQNLLGVDMLGQRKLHQDAVHLRVGVEALHERQDLLLGGALGQLVLERLHANLDGLLGLVLHIDLAGRVLAHEHHREPRGKPMAGLKCLHVRRHLLANICCDGFAIDDLGCHGSLPLFCVALVVAVTRRRPAFRPTALRSRLHCR